MRFLSRDSADEYSRDDDSREVTRLDIRMLGAVDRPDHGMQTELERAIRVQRDTAEYAAALQQQMDLLIRAYDAAFARWNSAKTDLEERTLEQEARLERQARYVAELETEILGAWESLEKAQFAFADISNQAEYYRNELAVVNRLGAERERRLTIAVHEVQQLERAAVERAEQTAKEADAALRKCEEHRERADWASDERARLAKCYDDACAQASYISQALSELERDTTLVLGAKDSEIDALKERCEKLEGSLLEHVNAAIEEARAESERLSALVHGVQQGRFWRLKRFAQRVRRVIHR